MMDPWEASLKYYPHFDAVISPAKIDQLVRNPSAVAKNSFYPFMRYEQAWQPFRSRKGGRPAKKERPIRFASRRDAYIFSYYRSLLSKPYEDRLKAHSINGSVTAYRRIREATGGGKSNIHFAEEAFADIRRLGNCAAVALDISSFFESLNHDRLRLQWEGLIGKSPLPPDHAAVFKAVTRYAVVDREDVYVRLGYARWDTINGRKRLTYLTPFDQVPTKLCSNSEFQEKVCGRRGKHKSLVTMNRKPHGIPQGSPISDLLANIYMLDFDIAAKDYCESRGGVYYRYSDDILLVVPGGDNEALAAKQFAMDEIGKHGSKLVIKEKKTSAIVYVQNLKRQTYKLVSGSQGRNGLEYLGFRYDGLHVRIRDATISRLYRKVAGSIAAECASVIKRYPGKSVSYLTTHFDLPAFIQRYGRVEDFDEKGDYTTWTFWTYVRKAMQTFGKIGRPIPLQLKNFRMVVERRVTHEIVRQLTP